MNATKVLIKSHPEYGEVGHRLNREIGLFCDPDTQEILHYWKPTEDSPQLPVVHIANRMVQGSLKKERSLFPRDKVVLLKSKKFL